MGQGWTKLRWSGSQSQQSIFEKYWPENQLKKSFESGETICETLRINQKNYEEAFIAHPDGKADVFIDGLKMRNRSLNGDVVYVKILPKYKWKIPLDVFLLKEEAFLAMLKTLDIRSFKMNGLIEQGKKRPNLDQSLENKNSGDRKKPNAHKNKNTVENKSSNAGKPSTISDTVSNPDEGSGLGLTECPSSNSILEMMNLDLKNENQSAKSNLNRFITVEDILKKDANTPLIAELKEHITEMFNKNSNIDFITFSPLLDLFPADCVIRTGKVVGIAEKVHNRCGAGTLKLISDKNKNMALFSPRDYKLPRIIIPAKSCPENFFTRPDDFKNVILIGKIENWYDNKTMPIGKIVKSVGNFGEIEPETEAILMENNVDFNDFSEEVLSCLPIKLPWEIPADELTKRRDFRQTCVFTIDPETARDLDDAVSCEHLGNGLFEVGVHIADVSYFVKPGTKLDQCAADRSTSVYMVQRVIPMLPQLLCEHLCSLNSGVDKLTFSVVWRLTEDGEILDEWFGRTIIRSAVKLAYNHAQGFIDNPKKKWTEEELPEISNGFTVSDIVDKVLQLHKISKCLKKKRVEGGTLRLDQVKLSFSLDKGTGMPRGWAVYEHLESHSLIEEFMLLANMAVAHKILRSNPETAVLRRHPSPTEKSMKEFLMTCKSLDLNLDGSSAGALQKSLNAITDDGTEDSAAKAQIIISICLKSMQQASYFCSGAIPDHEMWRHYALNVPLYTHFTSPIRRYPDILVHRLLAKSLGDAEALQYLSLQSFSKLHKQCCHSNQKKTNSKAANDKSIELFFAVFVKECGPLEEEGMVCNVLDRSFDVYIFKLAVTKRVYCEKLPLESFHHVKKEGQSKLSLVWSASETQPNKYEQEIVILTRINCLLVAATDDSLKWNLEMKHPLQH